MLGLLSNPVSFLFFILALLIAITIHEFSHAYVADRLGDPTPRLQGRVSLNPLVHLDPLGTLMIMFIGFGWGKPVVTDPFNLKNPRRDSAFISFAGPCANLVLALLLSILLRLSIYFELSGFYTMGSHFITSLISLNVILAVFNLLPIYPLDGFGVVGGVLPEEKAREWYGLQRYGIFFILLLILPLAPGGGSMLSFVLSPAVNFIMGLLLPSTGAGIL